jgi:hypothetical protein
MMVIVMRAPRNDVRATVYESPLLDVSGKDALERVTPLLPPRIGFLN